MIVNGIPVIPFRRMRSTLGVLQGAVLPVLATLDAKQLSREDTFLVAKILQAQSATRAALKTNPTRLTMVSWCAVWYILGKEVARLIAPELRDSLQAVLDEQTWVKELDVKRFLPEVKL